VSVPVRNDDKRVTLPCCFRGMKKLASEICGAVRDGKLKQPFDAAMASFLDQSILASGGFAVELDLRRTGLANVDESRALDMTGLYFVRIIHDSFLSPRCLERPGR